jgi:predicted deacetylase
VTLVHGDPLLHALDRLDAPVNFFVRDDDAGWADERLMALLRIMDAAGVPIDLAAIPAEVTPALAEQVTLRRRAGQAIGIHQHGHAHSNHETTGRKCEFGAARDAAQRGSDLRLGRARLQELFGDALDPIFTPPWNRVSADTPHLLAALGYAALSRDVTAPAQQALPEIPVHTDWSKQWRLAGEARTDPAAQIARDFAAHVQAGANVGLMLHHAAMNDLELQTLFGLLARWRQHPNARWLQMHRILTRRACT